MISLDTPRLHLRNFRPEDDEPLLRTARQYSASPMGIYDNKWPDTLEEIQKTVRWFVDGDSFIAVCLKETGKYIGFVDLMKSEVGEQKVYDLGYLFDFDYHGKGYASEACTAVVEYAFSVLHADKVSAGTAEANRSSQRVLAKLGFVKIGEGPIHFQYDAEGRPIEFTGYAYELTRESWEKNRSAQIQLGLE